MTLSEQIESLPAILTALKEHAAGITPIPADQLTILEDIGNEWHEVLSQLRAQDITATYLQSNPTAESMVEWKALADKRKLIDAIKIVRAQDGYGLREAKDIVEAYINRRYGFTEPA
jgi:hypothetical protein